MYFYRCTSITSLDISFSPNIHDETVGELLPELKFLLELSLEGCTYLGKNTIEAIATNCKRIETLNLSMLEYVTDDMVDKIAVNLYNLRELYLDHCVKVTDESLSIWCASQMKI